MLKSASFSGDGLNFVTSTSYRFICQFTSMCIYKYLQANNKCTVLCVGDFFVWYVFVKKSCSQVLMSVQLEFLVFLEKSEGVSEWVTLRPKRAKNRTKAKQWFHYTNGMGRGSEILPIPEDRLHLRLEEQAGVMSQSWLHNHHSWAIVKDLRLRMKESSTQFWALNPSVGCIKSNIDNPSRWLLPWCTVNKG